MKTGQTILMVGGEIGFMLRARLGPIGGKVEATPNAEESLTLLSVLKTDLIILGVNLTAVTRAELCRAIRINWKTPTIMVFVRDSESEKIEALDAGADDYFCKPFSFEVLMARIHAVSRRVVNTQAAQFSFPGLEIDFEARRVVAHGHSARLTPTELEILRFLIAHANKPVACRRLLEAIRGSKGPKNIETLRVFINQLRKKIGPETSQPVFTTTEPRVGYQFVIPSATALARWSGPTRSLNGE